MKPPVLTSSKNKESRGELFVRNVLDFGTIDWRTNIPLNVSIVDLELVSETVLLWR